MLKIILPLTMFSLTPMLKKYYIPLMTLITMIMLAKYNFYSLMTFNKFMFMDTLSYMMILLTILSTSLIIISSFTLWNSFILISMIFLILVMTFSTSNLFMFYMMFEIVLIPTFILITKVGYQPERLQASIYLMIYTIFASLPLLMGILNMKYNSNMITIIYSCYQIKFILIFVLAFLVKMPMFLFHLWLPKAHVEAPVEGSMILAAVLLKLGGYGIIRFCPMLLAKFHSLNLWIMSISLMGALITSMNCIRQKDLKSLIAYSSVAHMGLVLSSIMTLNYIGLYGAIIMMIAHGISSSALFLMVNTIYSINHTRNILSFKGLMNSFPNLTFWWFVFIASNIAAPPSINLASEIFMIMSLTNFNFINIIPLILISLFTSIFSIMLFMNTIHNKINTNISNPPSIKIFLSLLFHLIPLIFLITKLDIFSY